MSEGLLDILIAYSKDTGEDVQKYIDELMSSDVGRCFECRNWTGDRCRRFSCPPWAYCYTRADDSCSGGERK